MSVSALLVLGDRGAGLLEDKTMEQWFSSYIGESFETTSVCVCGLCVAEWVVYWMWGWFLHSHIPRLSHHSALIT